MKIIDIGVDLHKHQFTNYYLYNNDGYSGKFLTNEKGMSSFKNELKQFLEKGFKLRIAVESTGNTRYFKTEIEKLGIEVFVVNTLKFKVVNESVNKTDKRDAKTIAEFLAKDMLPLVNLSSEKSEKLRRFVSVRRELVKTRVKMKNTIHGMLLSFGIETKAGLLNSKKGLEKVLGMISDEENLIIVESIITTIKKLSEQIKDIEEKLKEMTKTDRVVKILESFPGTGFLNAITVRAYIDDIKRFSHFNKLGAYCGLVPWVNCSDETVHYGKITKRGPIELRTAIIQMVIGMIRCKDEKDNRLMTSYRNMKKNKGSGKAIVATARKLTKIIWTMLTNDEEYKKEKLNNALNNETINNVSDKAA
jgi:transposase